MRGYKRNKKLKVKLIAFTLLFLQLANPLAMYADDKYPIKTLKYTTPESEIDTNEMTLTIPIKNLKEVKDIRVKNGGSVEILSQDSKGVKVKLTGNNNPRKVLKKNKYSKNVNESEEKSSNDFNSNKSVNKTENHPVEGKITYSGSIPKSGTATPKKYTKTVTAQTRPNYSDSQGYSGNLTRYVYSGSYTPSDTKHVTNQSYQNYNSGGYSGTLSRYLHSGSEQQAASKDVTLKKEYETENEVPDEYNYKQDGFEGTLKRGRIERDISIKPCREKEVTSMFDYDTAFIRQTGNVWSKLGSKDYGDEVYYQVRYHAHTSSTGEVHRSFADFTLKDGDPRRYHRYKLKIYQASSVLKQKEGTLGNIYSGEVLTIPEGDKYKVYAKMYQTGEGKLVHTTNFKGTVKRPYSDTRVYRYQGNVTRPASDTRVYRYKGDVTKTNYVQDYSGTIYADGYDRYYKYDLEIDHTLLNVEEPTVTYNNKDWTNKDLNINITGNEVDRVKEIRYRLDGKEWEILPSEGGNIKIKDVSKLEIQSISNEDPNLNSVVKEIFVKNIDKQKPKIIIKR